ncbi:MAG: hypothetical protein P8Y60_11915 [Calditrichota bacterium]|jgi:hypothetical protein
MKKLEYLIALVFSMVILWNAKTWSESMTEFVEFIPESLGGWSKTEADQFYNRGNLYDYIDGGAELYLSYGFQSLVNRTYIQPGQPDIILDIFDMGSSRNAFGVFSHSREKVEKEFGQGSQYTAGSLLFWKDRYFISILASPETPESSQAIKKLSGIIESHIEKEGSLPALIDLLPRDSLIEESVKYFKHYIWLNSYYFIANQNILHIDETTDAVLAKYREKNNKSLLLLVQYPDAESANVAYLDFVKNYFPGISDPSAVRLEDGSWTGTSLKGNLIIAVFNTNSEVQVKNLIHKVSMKS